ncbi:lytic transglycosylase domain-containing protein [Microbacterium protaetiae]|uniref:Lytic transglycosylase domain-containing protein n=1 Tax=Microbacterium protaetiae TaxID=2509458 RepID=A0A4P6EV38_9MICO|nr:lytic transglycosylase domain-containing protein [Microbacterium protaetiae]
MAGFAVLGLAVACLSPLGAALAPAANAADVAPVTLYASAMGDAQSVEVASETTTEAASLERDSYAAAVKPKPKPTPTRQVTVKAASFSAPFVAPDPGTAQAIAYDMVTARGWDDSQFACLVALWKRESGWRVNASNPSGAYGIPQALPGSKMASAGADWATNPATQITWGLGYVSSRYGTPCGAWSHSQSTGWY